MSFYGLVDGSDSSLRNYLKQLPGVDQVGAEARAAMLATRSIKATSKAWAIDTAISMVDLTTLEGADTPGKVQALCSKAFATENCFQHTIIPAVQTIIFSFHGCFQAIQ